MHTTQPGLLGVNKNDSSLIKKHNHSHKSVEKKQMNIRILHYARMTHCRDIAMTKQKNLKFKIKKKKRK